MRSTTQNIMIVPTLLLCKTIDKMLLLLISNVIVIPNILHILYLKIFEALDINVWRKTDKEVLGYKKRLG